VGAVCDCESDAPRKKFRPSAKVTVVPLAVGVSFRRSRFDGPVDHLAVWFGDVEVQPAVGVQPVQLGEFAFQRYRLVLVEFSRERMMRGDRTHPEQHDAGECEQLRHRQPPSQERHLTTNPSEMAPGLRARRAVFEKRGAT
jgi:hypothetical protein